jgi:PcfJ-like protein
MSKKHKTIKEEQQLAKQQREDVINNVLKFSRKRFKKFDEVILQLYLGTDLSSFYADRRIWKVNECFTKFSSKTKSVDRAILKNVFVYLGRHSLLLSGEEYIHATFNMVQFRAYWRNDIFEWKPSSNRGAAQVNELAFYLFCQYKVPGFLYKAFYEKTNFLFINWFMHIGTGGRAKDLLKVPFTLSQKMAHYFLQAPEKFTIAEALRWAQVKGMMPGRAGTDGGDDKLAERIAYSWLGTKTYEDEDFWETFIRILVNGGMFEHDRLIEIIDYVRETKMQQENYSLKGRTLQSLMRQTDEWHRRTFHTKGNQFWSSCGLYGYKVERKEEVVKIEELTGSKWLADEGRTMKHCVSSYTHFCVAGKTAIFSLRKYSLGILTDRLATIEVNLSLKRVVQAKAKLNKKISDDARKHLDEWADKNELTISPYL